MKTVRQFFICFFYVLAVSPNAKSGTLIRCDYILTMVQGEMEPVDGYMTVSTDGKILSVDSGDAPDIEGFKFIDATGKIIIPGFVSGHNHLWQSAFRGIAGDEELYGWLQSLHWTYGKYFTDGDMYHFTLYGALDQLINGITTTLNHSQTVAPTYAHYMEQFEAEMDAGQHFVFSYVLDGFEESAEGRKAKLVSLIESTKALEGPHACLGFGLHGVGIYRNMDRHYEEVTIAKELGLDMQIHYLEEKAESYEKGQAKFADLCSHDGVWDGLVYAHFIHVTDEILEVSAQAGAKMIWNPLSNGRLASGLADIPRYLDSGIAIGMGVDGAASADICDPFQNMRMGMYALRMRDSKASVMPCYDILQLHTIKTAEVLEVADRVGSLEPGKYADFLIINPESPIFDPYATVVVASSASDIESVWVRGKPQVIETKLVYHDLEKIKDEVARRVDRIVAAEIAARD